jgi:hypothetical protein
MVIGYRIRLQSSKWKGRMNKEDAYLIIAGGLGCQGRRMGDGIRNGCNRGSVCNIKSGLFTKTGYDYYSDADYLRMDPAMRFALGEGHRLGAGQSVIHGLRMTFSVPFPDCAHRVTLRRRTLRNGLQTFGWRCIFSALATLLNTGGLEQAAGFIEPLIKGHSAVAVRPAAGLRGKRMPSAARRCRCWRKAVHCS